MKTGVAILAGLLVCGVLSFSVFKLMQSLIPAGPPAALLNDPSDLSPREPKVPRGPHQDDFVFNCTACHSTRLTMTQPSFPATKWAEIVKKMVTVYGAKIDAPLDEQIVKYLSTVKGVK